MKGLAKFLVETILDEAAEMDKVVVVYSGRFQPFHKGHYATYENLIRKFGKDSVYIGTSNVTDSKKSPFNFKEKKAIMMQMFGIPSSKIVNVKNPYRPEEILNKYDSDTTGLIVVVGEKDQNRLSGNYFTPYKGKVEQGYLDKGYVYASPAQSNPISGTDVRYWLSAGSEEERKKNFTKAYPKFDSQIFKLITLKLKSLKECINEEIKINVKIGDTILMGRFKNKKVIVKTIGTDDWGMPTINGKKVATFRIPKKEELKETASNSGFRGQDEPDTSFVADRQKRILNKTKPEGWYKQGGYTQLDKPKADNMRGVGKSKDTETQFRKSYYKINNVEKSTLNPADDPHKVEDWKEVKPKKAIKKPKRFWELPENQKDTIISKEDIKEIVEDFDNLLDEMGLGGGAGVGLSLPGGYINGAPNPKDVKKLKSKLDGDGSDEYTPVKEATASEIIKDLDKVKTDLLKKVDVLITKKKKLYSNVDIESPMSADEKKLDKDIQTIFSQIQQIIQQKRKIKENINESLLLEGGAYGHMNHPFDIEMNLTFGDLKQIVVRALNGDLELAREKTDGQALAISWVNGRLVAARNKSHLKNKGEGAMTIGQVATNFANRGALTDAYTFAMKDLSAAVSTLSEPQKKKIFKDGACFMNLEVIYPKNANVIPYGQNLLVFHGTFEYDESGEVIGENQQAASILAGMIKQVNKHVQSTYTIQGPPMLSLPKSEELTKKQGKYISMINKLQSEYKLSDSAGVADYHQAYWTDLVNKNAKGLDAQQKIGLVKRWAFGDKGFRIATIQDAKIKAWADNMDKKDQAKISKENIMKFEEIFLGVGADVLAFAQSVLTANPSDATKKMRAELGSAIKSLKANGTASQLDKLKIELQRLNSLGGFDKIVPNEGLVFVYNGNTYKLTGAFAPLNQILGIFKFSR
jgi:phosphopantetheine adenylyltransferase